MTAGKSNEQLRATENHIVHNPIRPEGGRSSGFCASIGAIYAIQQAVGQSGTLSR